MVTLLTGLVSGLLATILSLVFTKKINSDLHKRYEEKSFFETRMKMNELQLNEPYLRSDTILKEFLTDNEKDNNIILRKYDLFCIMQFNYFKSLCDYYGYNKNAEFTEKYNLKANISCYKEWWKTNHPLNTERYGTKFIEFIDGYLNSDRKKINSAV